jgi:hypothetical protein
MIFVSLGCMSLISLLTRVSDQRTIQVSGFAGISTKCASVRLITQSEVSFWNRELLREFSGRCGLGRNWSENKSDRWALDHLICCFETGRMLFHPGDSDNQELPGRKITAFSSNDSSKHVNNHLLTSIQSGRNSAGSSQPFLCLRRLYEWHPKEFASVGYDDLKHAGRNVADLSSGSRNRGTLSPKWFSQLRISMPLVSRVIWRRGFHVDGLKKACKSHRASEISIPVVLRISLSQTTIHRVLVRVSFPGRVSKLPLLSILTVWSRISEPGWRDIIMFVLDIFALA